MIEPAPIPETRIVCAILAAQAGALRSEIAAAAGVEIDFLFRISDVVTQATMRHADLQRNELPPRSAGHCPEVMAIEPGSALDAVAFALAQRLDLVSQMADCLVAALNRLAEDTGGLKAAELTKFYVSEIQQKIHDATLPGAAGQGER